MGWASIKSSIRMPRGFIATSFQQSMHSFDDKNWRHDCPFEHEILRHLVDSELHLENTCMSVSPRTAGNGLRGRVWGSTFPKQVVPEVTD